MSDRLDTLALSASAAGTAGAASGSASIAVGASIRGRLEAIKLSWDTALVTTNGMSVVISNRNGQVLLSVTGSASAVSAPFYRLRTPTHNVSGVAASSNTGFPVLEKPFVFDPILSISGMDNAQGVTATLYMDQ